MDSHGDTIKYGNQASKLARRTRAGAARVGGAVVQDTYSHTPTVISEMDISNFKSHEEISNETNSKPISRHTQVKHHDSKPIEMHVPRKSRIIPKSSTIGNSKSTADRDARRKLSKLSHRDRKGRGKSFKEGSDRKRTRHRLKSNPNVKIVPPSQKIPLRIDLAQLEQDIFTTEQDVWLQTLFAPAKGLRETKPARPAQTLIRAQNDPKLPTLRSDVQRKKHTVEKGRVKRRYSTKARSVQDNSSGFMMGHQDRIVAGTACLYDKGVDRNLRMENEQQRGIQEKKLAQHEIIQSRRNLANMLNALKSVPENKYGLRKWQLESIVDRLNDFDAFPSNQIIEPSYNSLSRVLHVRPHPGKYYIVKHGRGALSTERNASLGTDRTFNKSNESPRIQDYRRKDECPNFQRCEVQKALELQRHKVNVLRNHLSEVNERALAANALEDTKDVQRIESLKHQRARYFAPLEEQKLKDLKRYARKKGKKKYYHLKHPQNHKLSGISVQ